MFLALKIKPFFLHENCRSPKQLMSSVDSILDLAMDLDTGSFHGPSTAIILFAIRLCTRIEGYAAMILRHAEWARVDALSGGIVTGTGPTAPVRGLAVREDDLRVLASYHARMCEKLQGRAYGMLESWRMRLVEGDDITSASICHAHIGYIFAHQWSGKGMNWKAVESLLSCQIYLTHNYGFTLEASVNWDENNPKPEKEKKKDKDKVCPKP